MPCANALNNKASEKLTCENALNDKIPEKLTCANALNNKASEKLTCANASNNKASEQYQCPANIIYFGRLKKYKSVDHLFYAFAEVLKQFPDAELKIIGKGDYRKALEKLAIKLNISDNVTFLGFVPDEAKAQLLSSAFVVVNTSMKEGWGITNIETNACGTPVISANVPGLRDSVKDGVSGLLYEYGNIAELADKIKLLIQDTALRQKLSEGAVEWASSFSWDDAAEQMLAKMQEVINQFSLIPKNNEINFIM